MNVCAQRRDALHEPLYGSPFSAVRGAVSFSRTLLPPYAYVCACARAIIKYDDRMSKVDVMRKGKRDRRKGTMSLFLFFFVFLVFLSNILHMFEERVIQKPRATSLKASAGS